MIKTLSYNISELIDFIDWSYFFHAWNFSMKYSAIAQIHHCDACANAWINSFPEGFERKCAKEASILYNDAIRMLYEYNNKFKSYSKFGIFDANGNNDDIIIYKKDEDENIIPCLRQQNKSKEDICLCLSDFIRPKRQGIKDRIGIFASTVDQEIENQYPNDDYKHMLCQTLADRIAEATTELTHQKIRTKYWGYAKEEQLTKQQMLLGKFQGIRPAIGYPSLPDQSIIFIIEDILKISDIGIKITESGAMKPHASVCGFIFAHPKAKYFSVGKIDSTQLNDYAYRRIMPIETIKKFLQPNLEQ